MWSWAERFHSSLSVPVTAEYQQHSRCGDRPEDTPNLAGLVKASPECGGSTELPAAWQTWLLGGSSMGHWPPEASGHSARNRLWLSYQKPMFGMLQAKSKYDWGPRVAVEATMRTGRHG